MTLAHRGAAELFSHEFETAEATVQAALAVADEGFEEVRALASVVLSVMCLTSTATRKPVPSSRSSRSGRLSSILLARASGAISAVTSRSSRVASTTPSGCSSAGAVPLDA
jgi:hypothetical protein